MRFDSDRISPGLAAMLRKSGRHELIDTGFDIDELTLARSRAISPNNDHAIYHALFDRSAPHYAAIAPKVPDPGPPAVGKESLPTGIQVVSADPPSQLVHWLMLAALLVIALMLATGQAHAQPSGPLILRGSNGASILVTRSAGLLNFKCDGMTITCAWSASTNTLSLSAAGSSGVTSVSATSPFAVSASTGAITGSLLVNVDYGFTAAQSITVTGLGTSSADGLSLINTTAAANGAQQISPRARLSGKVWNTTASASQAADIFIENIPAQGSNTTATAGFRVSQQVNGGGSNLMLHVDDRFGVGIPALWLGSAAPTSTNFTLANNSGATVQLNAPGGGGNVCIGANSNCYLTVTSGNVTFDANPSFHVNNTTGAGTALLASNSPAVTNTAPYTWITVKTADGSTGYMPVWK